MANSSVTKKGSIYYGMEFQEMVDIKRKKRMEKFDKLDPAIRELVHSYGLNVVNAIMDVGVTKPKHIRYVVETVLDEFSPTRGTTSRQGIRTEVVGLKKLKK